MQNLLIKLVRFGRHLQSKHILRKRRKNWKEIFSLRNASIKEKEYDLSASEKTSIQSYYSKYGVKINDIFHQFYKYSTKQFNVRFIPDDIYYTRIDPYFNNWKLAGFLDNKTFYHFLFKDFKQPELIAYRQNGYWFDGNHSIITLSSVIELIQTGSDCFMKQATDSEGGSNIFVLAHNSPREYILGKISKISGDMVIQEGLKQSIILSQLNPSSVNTLRFLTLLRSDGTIKILSCSLRMGIDGARVDNASSGGITVGVNSDGELNDKAFSASGISYDRHPSTKIPFTSIQIPNFDKIVSLLKVEATKLPYFRLISWDIALDEQNEPILIEANLKYGELEFHQLNNGPIFGEDTDDILSEVFNKK